MTHVLNFTFADAAADAAVLLLFSFANELVARVLGRPV